MYILVYVDDILFTGSDESAIQQLLLALQTIFNMRNVGPVTYFLGLQVTQQADGLHLNQCKYAADLLHHMGMSECCLVSTLLPLKLSFSPATIVFLFST